MRTIANISIALIVALGSAVGLSGSAAAAGCSGSGCDGLGPVNNDCDNDAVLEYKVSTYVDIYGQGTAEMFYSRSCRAFWTRGRSLSSDTDHGADYQVRLEKRLRSDNSLLKQITITIASNQAGPSGFLYDWTNMLGQYPGRKIRACVGHSGTYKCTPYLYS